MKTLLDMPKETSLCARLAIGSRGNGERMRTWRERGNEGREEMEIVRANGVRMRKCRENEEITDSIYGICRKCHETKLLTYVGNNFGSKQILRNPYNWCPPTRPHPPNAV